MDKSEHYVQMCKAASEVQEMWELNPAEGDWYIDENDEVDIHNIAAWGEGMTLFPKYWLPRQDQLQEMVVSNYENWHDLGYDFAGYIGDWSLDEMPYKSFEQLWLAFVMSEKFNKVWNGTEWEKVQ